MIDNDKSTTNDYREPIKGEEAYRLWLNRVDEAIAYRQTHWNGDKHWNKWLKNYAGLQWDFDNKSGLESSDNPRDYITVNKTLSVIKDTLAFIAQNNPLFMAEPELPDDALSAKVQAQLLNLTWRIKEMNLPLREILLDMLIFGLGIGKTGFWFEVDDLPRSEVKDGTFNYDDFVTREECYFYRVNPFQFVWDYANSTTLERSRWCAEVIFKPLSDVMNNESYSKKAINSILNGDYKPMTYSTYENESATKARSVIGYDTDSDCDSDNIVLFEIWDKKYKKYYLFAKDVVWPLIEKDWPYDYLLEDGEGFPYEVITYIDIPNEPFPISIPYLIEDQQYEKNRIRTSQIDRRRKDSRKYGIRKGSLEETEMSKLEAGEDGTIVEFDGGQESIWAIPEMNFSSDAANVEAKLDQDILELVGSDALTSGGRLPSRTSSNEISARTQIAGKKIGDLAYKVDIFVKNIGYKQLSHMRHNIYRDQVVKLIGAAGEYWQTFNRDQLSSRITLSLESTSKEPVDPVIERQQRTSIYQMTLQSLQILSQSGVQINLGELFKWVLESYGTQDISRFFPNAAIITKPIPNITQDSAMQQQQGQVPLQNPQQATGQEQLVAQQGQSGAGGVTAEIMGSLLGGG